MNDTTQTLLRSVLKIGAGALISRGLINGNEAEALIAAVAGLIAVVWGVMHRTPSIGTDGIDVPIQQATGFELERIRPEEQESQITNRKSQIPTVGPTGRALVCMAIAGALLSGCAWQHTASIHNPDGSLAETYTGVVWFNKTALKGLEAHKKTANGSSTALSLKEGNTETQPEALKAGSESLGMLIGTAMKYAK